MRHHLGAEVIGRIQMRTARENEHTNADSASGLDIAHDHVHPQPMVQPPAMRLGASMHIFHALGQQVLGFWPHQIDVALCAAQIQRLGAAAMGVAAQKSAETAGRMRCAGWSDA